MAEIDWLQCSTSNVLTAQGILGQQVVQCRRMDSVSQNCEDALQVGQESATSDRLLRLLPFIREFDFARSCQSDAPQQGGLD